MTLLIATESFYCTWDGRDYNAGQTLDLPTPIDLAFMAAGLVDIAPYEASSGQGLVGKYSTRAMRSARQQAEEAAAKQEAEQAVESHVEEDAEPERKVPRAAVAEEKPADEDPEDARREQVLSSLRKTAEALGVDVDGRWGEERLKRAINTARVNRYQRRDMQAKE